MTHTNNETIVQIILGRLRQEGDAIATAWNKGRAAGSTAHFVVDDLLPPELAHEIYEAFPQDAHGFFIRNDFRERKKTLTDLSASHPVLSAITYALQDQRVISEIGDLTALAELQPDPSLYAAGLSMMVKGDFLNPHIDNSHNRERSLYRRLNLLYYVSPEWSTSNGGNFELWEPGVRRQEVVPARFNRLLVMETTKTSWHSVDEVTVDAPRCCVSTYVFSPSSDDGTAYFHVTSFLGRPGQTFRRAWGQIDNRLRQTVSTALKTGRGVKRINKTAP